MVGCFIILGIALVLLVFYIILKCKKYDVKELYFKTIISMLFVTLALVATLASDKFTIFNVLIIIGLLFGLVGDILLDLKYVDKERAPFYTYGGFVSFGIGHIFYMTGLILNFMPNDKAYFLAFAFGLDVIFAIATILMEKPMKLEYGKMKKISFVYALCLFGSVSVSFFLAIANSFSIVSLNLFMIASISFAASDLILSGTYFGKGKERPIDIILNYAFYYSAQYLIALLLLYL